MGAKMPSARLDMRGRAVVSFPDGDPGDQQKAAEEAAHLLGVKVEDVEFVETWVEKLQHGRSQQPGKGVYRFRKK